MGGSMADITKVETDVRVYTQAGQLSFSIVGTGSGVEGLDKLGAYIGEKVHLEVGKIVGFSRYQRQVAEAQSDVAAFRAKAAKAEQALNDERALAEQARLAAVAGKRSK